jgi:hypothetical protein
MPTPPTATVDLRSLGYPECYIRPLEDRLFEVSPVIHRDWEIWSRFRIGFTGNDMYREMSDNMVLSDTASLPTLRHFLDNQANIPESWIGNRIFGLKGTVVHRDGDSVAPYLDCRDMTQIYIGFFRLKGNLSEFDAFIVLRQ